MGDKLQTFRSQVLARTFTKITNIEDEVDKVQSPRSGRMLTNYIVVCMGLHSVNKRLRYFYIEQRVIKDSGP
jgi:hypothetical protein